MIARVNGHLATDAIRARHLKSQEKYLRSPPLEYLLTEQSSR
jgi:hypothetical protein